jgi:hypothetical protein
MSINILKLKLLTYIFRALFLLVTSFRVRIIINSLSAACWISIIIVLYDFGVPSCLIAFDIPAGGQYTMVGCGSTKLPIIICLVGAVLFI